MSREKENRIDHLVGDNAPTPGPSNPRGVRQEWEPRELRDRQFCLDVILRWKALRVTKVKVSKRTFESHLQWNPIMAGPWDIRIRDQVPYGDVWLYAPDGSKLGTMTVSDVAVH